MVTSDIVKLIDQWTGGDIQSRVVSTVSYNKKGRYSKNQFHNTVSVIYDNMGTFWTLVQWLNEEGIQPLAPQTWWTDMVFVERNLGMPSTLKKSQSYLHFLYLPLTPPSLPPPASTDT